MYLAIACGRKTGVFPRGAKTSSYVNGFPGFRARKFDDYTEAEAYVKLYRGVSVAQVPDNLKEVKKMAALLREEAKRKEKETVLIEGEKENMEPADSSLDTSDDMEGINYLDDTLEDVVDTEQDFTPFLRNGNKKVLTDPLRDFKPGPLDWQIFSDGSYFPESGSGGYAAVLVLGGHTEVPVYVSGSVKKPGKGSMETELVAVCKALKRLKKYKPKGQVVVYCDFEMIVRTINDKAKLKEQTEGDCSGLWRKVIRFADKYPLWAVWIPSHSGIRFNEACDKLARLEAGLVL